MYHGSNTLYSVLKPQYSHLLKQEALYGSQFKEIALCFSGGKWRDEEISLGSKDGVLYLDELKKNAFKVLKVSGWLYEVSPQGFTHDDRLCDFEFFNRNEVIPIRVVQVKNILDELKKLNIQISYKD